MMATWTEEDIETLRTFYSLEGTAVNARFSTPHSPGSICQKALALGVSGPRRLRHKRHVDDSMGRVHFDPGREDLIPGIPHHVQNPLFNSPGRFGRAAICEDGA